MFDSIRLRLTFWYLGVLASVIIAFAVLTYFLVVKTLNRQTDENLVEMARNFKAAVDSELSADSDETSIENEISEEISESRFHDFEFLVTTSDNSRLVSSTSPDVDLNQKLLEGDSNRRSKLKS